MTGRSCEVRLTLVRRFRASGGQPQKLIQLRERKRIGESFETPVERDLPSGPGERCPCYHGEAGTNRNAANAHRGQG